MVSQLFGMTLFTLTEPTVLANKPDIVVKDLRAKTCLIIDVAIPMDENIVAKEAEKRIKYKDLEIEIQMMWNLRTKVNLSINGALGTVGITIEDLLRKIPDKHNLKELQKTSIIGTGHILRKSITQSLIRRWPYGFGPFPAIF